MGTLHQPHDLSAHLAHIESRLEVLEHCLREQDAPGMDAAAQALHEALATAVAACQLASHQGRAPLSAELKQRIALAQTRVNGLQLSVHRAASSLQRTLGVLLAETETPDAAAYAALGKPKSLASTLGKAYGA
jgi:hypothetical protein